MAGARCTPLGQRAQLFCGAVAGQLFTGGFTAIAATRAGYDWRNLPVSSSAIGRRGWLRHVNFSVTGLLYSCPAEGLRRSATEHVGPRVVPALVAGLGVGLIGSGVFVTDPAGRSGPDPAGGASPGHAGLVHD